MGKKSRRQRRKAPLQTADIPVPDQETPPAPLLGLDRILTLLAFVGLVGLVVFFTPILGQRSQQAFEQRASALLQALEQPESASALHEQLSQDLQTRYSPDSLNGWLQQLTLDQLSQTELVFQQTRKQRGLLRAHFERQGQPGLLTASFMNAPSLSLENRWQVMNLCRSDREISVLLQKLREAVQQNDAPAAYALSAAGQGLQRPDTGGAEAWLKQLRQLGLQSESAWQWGLPEGREAMLRVSGQQGTLRLEAEIIENPEQCQYLLASIRLKTPDQ
ncbi:MAG: hypothetical protein IGS03_11355 [Candidatus Sericytochromatia bacterium]|nr:hypothetical protein [Candidatus Sericytochromatia bacterium]